jgi:hypothetical protein
LSTTSTGFFVSSFFGFEIWAEAVDAIPITIKSANVSERWNLNMTHPFPDSADRRPRAEKPTPS